MQVIRRLKLNAVVSVLTTVIILVVLFLAVYHINQAMNKLEIADNIMSASFERVALRIDYQRTGNESAKAQYLAKHEQIGRLLKDASRMFEDAEDKETIKKMINSHESIGRIFAAIATNREAKMLGQSHSGFSAEIETG
jgi:cell division protein FtsL